MSIFVNAQSIEVVKMPCGLDGQMNTSNRCEKDTDEASNGKAR